MFTKECAACGGRFSAKRDSAKYCSGRCRTRAYEAKSKPAPPPERREAPTIVALPPRPSDEDGFAAGTRRELEAAGRLDTYLGRAAMYLAQVADASSGDTGSGHASLMKQYTASMAAALDGAQKVETPLERIRQARQMKAG